MKRSAPRKNSSVKVLGIDGKILPNTYMVQSVDNGYADLADHNGKTLEKVHVKRLYDAGFEMAVLIDGGAFDGNKRAICPKCNGISVFEDKFVCSVDGEFEVTTIGDLQMTTVKKTEQKEAKVTKTKQDNTAKLDLAELKSHGELWVKNAAFDHVQVTALAYTYIVGNRKFCFNTYNGALGKRAQPINVEHIRNGVDGNGKPVGYAVADLTKEHEKLKKNGFHKV